MDELTFDNLNELFQMVLNQVPTGIVVLDSDLRLRFINERHAKNNRLSVAEQLGKRPSEYIPHIAPVIEPKLQFVIDHGIPLLNQEIIGTPSSDDGRVTHRVASYYPWRNRAGDTIGILGIIQDSTIDEFSQQLIAESEHRLLNVLDNLFTFVGVLELDGTLSHANKAPLDAADIVLENVRGKKLWDTYWFEYSTELQNSIKQNIKDCLNGEIIRYDMQVRMRDNQLMWIDFMLAPLRDVNGTITHLIPSGNDISQRHQSEESLQLSEARAHSIIMSSDEAIITKTLEGTITAWNPAAERLLGYREDEAIGRNITMLFPDDKLAEEEELLQRIANNERITPFETVRVHKNGKPIEVCVTISPLRNRHGEVIGACKLARDISVQNQQKSQIQAALEEKTSLLHEVHHRVKNNLQIVSSLLNMQARKVSRDAAMAIEECQLRIRSMALVHQLLYESDNMASVDISLYLEELIQLAKKSYENEQQHIDIKFSKMNAKVTLDIQRAIPCGLIVTELVLNAMKHAFTDRQSGEVRIVLANDESSRFKIDVSDNGRGLPENFTWGGKRSLGAQLIPMFVQQLDAELITQSNSAGSCFTIHIPYLAVPSL